MLKKNIFLLAFLLLLIASCKDKKEEGFNNDTRNEPTQDSLVISNNALLDTVERQTLKYFWEYAEPNSGMARERFHPDGNYPNNDADIVTTGGTGFGLMGIIAGVDRGFINRDSAVARFNKIADFLQKTPRYHGAWPHWMNGKSSKTKAFSKKDDGGDVVETSFLSEGLIVVREYFKNGNEKEKQLADKYDKLWKGIEWNWYTNNGNALIWHWSPEYKFEKNFKIQGYNECLITYVMAASSPDYSIKPEVYDKGWARGGDITTDVTAYGLPLILKHNTGGDKGGPLFWAHYSYLGLDPRGLSDKYANYWDLNVNHATINYKYTQENPKHFDTYSDSSWGLTASYTRNPDGSIGYAAHSPDDDRGVVSPTAAVSSIPYTPEKSMRAMRYFYTDLHKLLWGPAGFYDAYSLENGKKWVAPWYLAIDQGPQIVMIENYRSGLIWNLFMGAPEIQKGLKKLGFTYEK
ncbi:MAG: glucoamylase family protein [Gillisia sp.]